MKSVSFLLAFVLSVTASALVFGATAAFSAAVMAGVVAIALHDYGRADANASVLALNSSLAGKSHRLPLAA